MEYVNLLHKICKRNNIKITSMSDDWIHLLEKNGERHFIVEYTFELNPCSVARCLDDKYAFYKIMRYSNNPIIAHNFFYKTYDRLEVQKLYHQYHDKVVVKKNIGTAGREVFLCDNLDTLYKTLDELINYGVCICPYVEINCEYRVVVLNNKVELIFGKVKPIVVGDGQKSIEELLIEFNPSFFNKEMNLPKDILPKNQIYAYNWQFNLSQGASATTEIDASLKNKLETLALKVAKDANIKFASIDIIVDQDNKLYLMEANNGVSMNKVAKIIPHGEKIVESIYEKAIKLMFKENIE